MATSKVGDVFRPGDIVPISGFYVCTVCSGTKPGHRYSTDVRGHRFPPTLCAGGQWRLAERRP